MIWNAILSFLVGLLEKVGLAWLEDHRVHEAENVQNNIDAMSDDAVSKQLYDDWTRK